MGTNLPALRTALDVTKEQSAGATTMIARWQKDLPIEHAAAMAKVAMAYGLDPFLGEITLYEGKLYPTIQGLYRIAQSSGKLAGIDVQPATEEQRRSFGARDGEQLWVATVARSDFKFPTTGWGWVKADDRNRMVGKSHPQLLARKRAVYQALLAAFYVSRVNLPGGGLTVGAPDEVIAHDDHERAATHADFAMLDPADPVFQEEAQPVKRDVRGVVTSLTEKMRAKVPVIEGEVVEPVAFSTDLADLDDEDAEHRVESETAAISDDDSLDAPMAEQVQRVEAQPVHLPTKTLEDQWLEAFRLTTDYETFAKVFAQFQQKRPAMDQEVAAKIHAYAVGMKRSMEEGK